MGKMTLYNLEACPYCVMVRNKLKTLKLEYETINVPGSHRDRHEVLKVSGQYFVPVLVDGETILDDEDKILYYLDEKYGSR
ncbi:MAG: glutathione S-transferase N-terminal domain-containing protein [Nitrospirota bacterium]